MNKSILNKAQLTKLAIPSLGNLTNVNYQLFTWWLTEQGPTEQYYPHLVWELAWLKSYQPLARGPSRQHRAVSALLARVKIYFNPPYGLDSLWFASIKIWFNCWIVSNFCQLAIVILEFVQLDICST